MTMQTRRIVVCLDGTWNNPYQRKERDDGTEVVKPSNPLKMCRAVLPRDSEHQRDQITYYDSGVGALGNYPGISNRILARIIHQLKKIRQICSQSALTGAIHIFMHILSGAVVIPFAFVIALMNNPGLEPPTEFLAEHGGLDLRPISNKLSRFSHTITVLTMRSTYLDLAGAPPRLAGSRNSSTGWAECPRSETPISSRCTSGHT